MSSMSEQPCQRPEIEVQVGSVTARVSAIEEELNRPLTELGFRKAAELITELENLGGSYNYDTLLRVAEYELQISREKHNVALKNLKDYLERLSETSRKETFQTSINLSANGRNIAASIVIWTYYELFDMTRVTPIQAVNWIRNQIEGMSRLARILAVAGGRSRGIAIEFSIKKMNIMLECLRERKRLDIHRALSEGKCLFNISEVHYEAKMFSEASRVAMVGIVLISQQLNDQAPRCSIFVQLVNCVGKAHVALGEGAQVESHSVQSEGTELIASDSADVNQRILDLRTENTRADISPERSSTVDES